MASLADIVQDLPCHILYLGTEPDFIRDIQELDVEISDPEKLEFTCCESVQELMSAILADEQEFKTANVYVYGLKRYLNSLQDFDGNYTQQINAIASTNVGIKFSDS